MLNDQVVLKLVELLGANGISPPEGSSIEGIANTWRMLLPEYDDQGMVTLVTTWLRSSGSQYARWPTPGALLEAARQAEPDDAEEAWGLVLDLIRRIGIGVQPQWEGIPKILAKIEQTHDADTIKACVKAVGGWKTIAHCPDSLLGTHRASFRSAYRAIRERQRLERAQGHLRLVVDNGKLLEEG